MIINKHNYITSTSVKIRAVITKSNDGCLKGELACGLYEKAVAFDGIMNMIDIMETTFDLKGFPEKQLLPRTFSKQKQRINKHEMDLHAYLEKYATAQAEPAADGKICTFDISVRFRHNAEWQGDIHWLERDVNKRFSSIVELLRIIDFTLTSA